MNDTRSLLAFDCGSADMSLKKSVILHKDVGQGDVSGCQIEAQKVLRYYNGSIVHSDLDVQKQVKKTYIEDVMVVTVEQVTKWTFKVLNTIVDRRGVEKTS